MSGRTSTASAERELVVELIRLRRGWALQARQLRGRLGPHLALRSGVRVTDGDREAREKVRTLLTTIISCLPPELAHAARVAFALDRGHQHRQLTLRIEALASEQSWAPRTARRRMDHALRLMAQAILGQPETDPDGGSGERSDRHDDADLDLSSLSAVVRLQAAQRLADETGLVVVRVPVPGDRFALLITFDATGTR
jgi:hypothetical protein